MNTIKTTTEYIALCENKIEEHHLSAVRARRWYNIFSIVNVITTSSLAVTMTIMATLGSIDMHISIVGAAFGFFIGIFNKITSEYDLKTLSTMHFKAEDDYREVLVIFNEIVHEYNDGNGQFNVYKYEMAVREYIRAVKTYHLLGCKNRGCFG